MQDLFNIAPFTFAHPKLLLLLLLIPLLVFRHYTRNRHQHSTLILSSLEGLPKKNGIGRAKYLPLLFWLRMASIAALIVALARPQTQYVNERQDSEGIDIVMSIDISGSMLAEDFKPNRLEAAKKVAEEFIVDRITDRIGLVIFSGESFTQTPLTTDKNILLYQLANIESGQLKDGTAIGMGLATAVNRLRSSKAASKVIILLTDGVNNSGLVDPITALEIAKSFKTRVYTIGVGSKGTAPYPMPTPSGGVVMKNMPVQIDEALLRKIANETGGQYFRATNNNTLRDIYQQIDKLERSEVEIASFKRYSEKFFPFAFLSILFLFIELLLRFTYLRSFP